MNVCVIRKTYKLHVTLVYNIYISHYIFTWRECTDSHVRNMTLDTHVTFIPVFYSYMFVINIINFGCDLLKLY